LGLDHDPGPGRQRRPRIADRRRRLVKALPIRARSCQFGDLLARWTNDLYRSTPHRVINNSPDAIAIPALSSIRIITRGSSAANCKSADNPPRYAICTARTQYQDVPPHHGLPAADIPVRALYCGAAQAGALGGKDLTRAGHWIKRSIGVSTEGQFASSDTK